MVRLSAHFYSESLACKGNSCCGNSFPISEILLWSLEVLRSSLSTKLGKETPLYINSGFRCLTHNSRTKGASPNSQHCNGTAVDISTPAGVSDEDFYDFCVRLEIDGRYIFKGIGLYNGRVHVDVRHTVDRAFWDSKNNK